MPVQDVLFLIGHRSLHCKKRPSGASCVSVPNHDPCVQGKVAQYVANRLLLRSDWLSVKWTFTGSDNQTPSCTTGLSHTFFMPSEWFYISWSWFKDVGVKVTTCDVSAKRNNFLVHRNSTQLICLDLAIFTVLPMRTGWSWRTNHYWTNQYMPCCLKLTAPWPAPCVHLRMVLAFDWLILKLKIPEY